MGDVLRTYQTDSEFVADILVSGFKLQFTASTQALASGASLTALKNKWVRDVMGAHPNLFDKASLQATGKEAVLLLRDIVEPYFAETHP